MSHGWRQCCRSAGRKTSVFLLSSFYFQGAKILYVFSFSNVPALVEHEAAAVAATGGDFFFDSEYFKSGTQRDLAGRAEFLKHVSVNPEGSKSLSSTCTSLKCFSSVFSSENMGCGL